MKTNQKIEQINFVSSSTIENIKYDFLMENLDVSFKNGGVYRYCGVPEAIFNEMKESPSAGRYFHENIKNKFDFIKK